MKTCTTFSSSPLTRVHSSPSLFLHKPRVLSIKSAITNPTFKTSSQNVTATSSVEKLPTPLSSASFNKVAADSLQYETGFLGAVPEKLKEDDDDCPSALWYLTSILSSKVYDVAIESPLDHAKKLSDRLGVKFLLKREDLQPVFSFKLRGAYNMMAKLPRDQLDRGVICSSAGNHAQGVALAARKLGCDAVIVMPVTTPGIKVESVQKLGATVVLKGDSYDEAQAHAKQRSDLEGRTFIPPFDHPDVIAGQGTVGLEILRQANGPLYAVFVPVGGGGLIAGIAAYIKQVAPEVKIIGVEPADANALALSFHHGQRVMLEQAGGFADGVAVKVVGEETFRLCRELVDGVVLVSKDAICASIKDMFEEKRSILEPAGALAIAGAEAYCKYYGLKNETVVAIASGANMNFSTLKLVAELADIGRQREAVLSTCMPEEPGSFKRFCELVGPKMNITEFKYRCDVSDFIRYLSLQHWTMHTSYLHTIGQKRVRQLMQVRRRHAQEALQGSKMELQEIKEMLSQLVPNYRRTATIEEQLVPRDEDDAPSDHSLHSSSSDVYATLQHLANVATHLLESIHPQFLVIRNIVLLNGWLLPHNRSISNPPSPIRGIQTPYHTYGVRERNHSTYNNKNLDFEGEGEDLRTHHRQVPNLVPPNQVGNHHHPRKNQGGRQENQQAYLTDQAFCSKGGSSSTADRQLIPPTLANATSTHVPSSSKPPPTRVGPITCYECKEIGHVRSDCPKRKRVGLTQDEENLTHPEEDVIEIDGFLTYADSGCPN
ncbi:hypothetical protein IFM89_006062 [Coptis chinensis]|uniref:Threonine dehydratase n=1 Tax=Coptis chinensis TaxID=261450 RepID=A0A835LLI3_9MAGN|nr:hypothetical protein IFM89_006062 [Coptis chinensis]